MCRSCIFLFEKCKKIKDRILILFEIAMWRDCIRACQVIFYCLHALTHPECWRIFEVNPIGSISKKVFTIGNIYNKYCSLIFVGEKTQLCCAPPCCEPPTSRLLCSGLGAHGGIDGHKDEFQVVVFGIVHGVE